MSTWQSHSLPAHLPDAAGFRTINIRISLTFVRRALVMRCCISGRVVLVAMTALCAIASGQPASAAPRTAREKRVDGSIVRALKYLAEQQRPSGGWRLSPYRRESTAATSLAVMSFLAAGHVPGEGPYGSRLEKAVEWVLDHQVTVVRTPGKEAVTLVNVGSGDHGMYSHGISTLMLAEVVGMLKKDQRKRCRETLEKAIRLILVAQNLTKSSRNAGGWRYSHTARDSDLSVTGWQLLALRAAKDVGCDVPKGSIDRAVAYVKKCRPRFGPGFTYQSGGSATATRTGTGILCLEICGQHKSKEAIAGAEYLLRRPLRERDRWFFYGAYYCTVGMFKVGGKYWEAAKSNTQDLLLDMQMNNGSWSARRRSSRGGPIYCTAMSVLALAVEYRYLPIYQR